MTSLDRLMSRGLIAFVVILIGIMIWGDSAHADDEYALCKNALHAAKEKMVVVAYISQSDLVLLSQETQRQIKILATIDMARQDANKKCEPFIQTKR